MLSVGSLLRLITKTLSGIFLVHPLQNQIKVLPLQKI